MAIEYLKARMCITYVCVMYFPSFMVNGFHTTPACMCVCNRWLPGVEIVCGLPLILSLADQIPAVILCLSLNFPIISRLEPFIQVQINSNDSDILFYIWTFRCTPGHCRVSTSVPQLHWQISKIQLHTVISRP